jgi:hypothetical protein
LVDELNDYQDDDLHKTFRALEWNRYVQLKKFSEVRLDLIQLKERSLPPRIRVDELTRNGKRLQKMKVNLLARFNDCGFDDAKADP